MWIYGLQKLPSMSMSLFYYKMCSIKLDHLAMGLKKCIMYGLDTSSIWHNMVSIGIFIEIKGNFFVVMKFRYPRWKYTTTRKLPLFSMKVTINIIVCYVDHVLQTRLKLYQILVFKASYPSITTQTSLRSCLIFGKTLIACFNIATISFTLSRLL